MPLASGLPQWMANIALSRINGKHNQEWGRCESISRANLSQSYDLYVKVCFPHCMTGVGCWPFLAPVYIMVYFQSFTVVHIVQFKYQNFILVNIIFRYLPKYTWSWTNRRNGGFAFPIISTSLWLLKTHPRATTALETAVGSMPLELVSSFTMAAIFNIDSKNFEICNGRRQKGKKARRKKKNLSSPQIGWGSWEDRISADNSRNVLSNHIHAYVCMLKICISTTPSLWICI